MKIKTKFLSILLVFCMVVCGIPTQASAAESKSVGGDILKNLYTNELKKTEVSKEEVELQDELCTTFTELTQNMAVNMDENGNLNAEKIEFESYYAGAYIDDNKLVVCITEDEAEQKIEASGINTENIEYRVVKNSYNALSNVKDEITNQYIEYGDKYSEGSAEYDLIASISSIAIDEEENAVIVNVSNLTSQNENTFVNLFGDYDCVTLTSVANEVKECNTFKPGQAVYYIVAREGGEISEGRVSVGYRAYRKLSDGTKQYGFVTCGHGIQDAVDKKVYSSNSFRWEIGKVTANGRETRSLNKTDASFVKLTGKHTASNQVMYSDSKGTKTNGSKLVNGGLLYCFPQGMTVYIVGSKTYKTVGTVEKTKYSDYLRDEYGDVYEINDGVFQVKCSTYKKNREGDSGGLIYTYYRNGFYPIGILSGKVVQEFGQKKGQNK